MRSVARNSGAMTASQDPEIQLSEVPAVRNVRGAVKAIAAVLSTGLSLYALSWVLVIVQPQIYRITFLLIALVLIFLLFPRDKGRRAGVEPAD